MFAPLALLFLMYALVDAVLTFFEAKRFRQGLQDGVPKWWTIARFWFLFGIIGTFFDNLRVFWGGFWSDVPEGEEPIGAGMIYPMLVLHAFVALFTTGIGELGIASFKIETEGIKPKAARLLIWLISFSIFVISCMNTAAEINASSELGLEREEKFGVVRFGPRNLTEAAELGYIGVPGTELAGVIWFSLVAVIVGGIVWYKFRFPWLFILSLAALAGQGIGPPFPDYFYFASNFWEVIAFLGLVLADYKVFNMNKEVAGEGAKTAEASGQGELTLGV